MTVDLKAGQSGQIRTVPNCGMNAVANRIFPMTSPKSISQRISAIEWKRVSHDLDAHGSAMIKRLLFPEECRRLAELYAQDENFRSRVVMERYGFGRREYKYFKYPLPDLIADFRTVMYPYLVPIANRWNADMGLDVRYPEQHAEFIARCHHAGQVRPTPLILSTAQTIITARIRISMVSMFFRSR
jgi:hypothetical protein